MAITQPDLAIPLRAAILGNSTISGLIPEYADGQAVFSRRPIPADVVYPAVVISPDLAHTDQGFLSAEHLTILRDIGVYGTNETPTTYRNAEALARAIFDLFHRQRRSITVSGWNVLQIWAKGPMVAPDDSDMIVGRIVQLSIELVASGL